jgi:serine/threonine protein kinase
MANDDLDGFLGLFGLEDPKILESSQGTQVIDCNTQSREQYRAVLENFGDGENPLNPEDRRMFKFSAKPVDLSGVLDTKRYELLMFAGKGCWGDVYKARDRATGETVALKVLNPSEVAKRQMEENKLTPFSSITKESGLAACRHVVPSSYEIDEKGTPYVKMPYYQKTLAEQIEPCNHRLSLDNGLPLEDILKYMGDIALGLSEMHTIRKKVHRDLKPDNIMIDEKGRAIINDLGTATCAEFGWLERKSKDSNRGHIYTRAPEGFTGKDPDKQYDNYAWACLAYRLFTGKYPLEDEIDNSKDPAKFFEQLGKEGVDKLLQKKVRKNIPRKLRKIIGKNLRYSAWERNRDGEELHSELKRTIENMNGWKVLKRHARNAMMYAALPVGMLALMAYNIETHEPLDLKMPQSTIHGVLYPNQKLEDQIEFESEEIKDLPKATGGLLMGKGTKYAKACTNNRVIAYLVKCQWQAQTSLGGMRSPQIYTDNQFNDYTASRHSKGETGPDSSYPGQPWNIWAKSIEYALTQAKHDGKVDLEDVCAISRVGIEKVDEAKRISKSFDYSIYRDAKYAGGEYVIPRDEKRFIDTWISYFHSDVD